MDEAAREIWTKRVERWKDSGLTAKEFAAEMGLRAQTLMWWQWRLSGGTPRKRGRRTPPAASRAIAKAATPSPLSFIEMTASVLEPLEVVFSSTLRVRVPVGFDDATLGRLLDVLERRR
jgi:transposase